MWFIIGANALVFFIELRLGGERLQGFIETFGLVPKRFAGLGSLPPHEAGLTLATLLTNAFLHGGWLHFLGNMWVFYIFGDNVEDRMGPFRFTAFYLLVAVLASLTHLFTNWGSAVPALGASGAISGVMGAYLILYPAARVIVLIPILFFPFFFTVYAYVFLVVWFLFQFWQGTLSLKHGAPSAGIAFWAHVGGFVAGIILLPFFLRPRGERRGLHGDEGAFDSSWSRRIPRKW